MNSAPPFELLETLLWRDGYVLLPGHLERLQGSAAELGFENPTSAVEEALAAEALSFEAGKSYRLRVLAARDGGVRVERGLLPPLSEGGTVVLAREATDSEDLFLRHKTTHRELYTRLYREAAALGHEDALFRNEKGEITEGAISNVFVERGGRLLTPPLTCGLLPGVQRRHILEHDPRAGERVLFLEDLREAEALFIANSVRGLRKVRLVETA